MEGEDEAEAYIIKKRIEYLYKMKRRVTLLGFASMASLFGLLIRGDITQTAAEYGALATGLMIIGGVFAYSRLRGNKERELKELYSDG